jgi:transposase
VAKRRVPAGKKNAFARGATLVFLDESGYSLTPTVRRTFAPRGKTPICRSRKYGGKISAISAITLSPKQKRTGLYFELLPDNKNVEAIDTVSFLKELKRHLPKKLTIIWDRSKVHDHANVVKNFLAKHRSIVTEKFPAYAPELNPDEGVWAYTKYGRLANYAPTNTTELRTKLTDELNHLRHRNDLLASFIQQTDLPLKL